MIPRVLLVTSNFGVLSLSHSSGFLDVFKMPSNKLLAVMCN